MLNGTIGEMHARKIARLYEFAMKTGAPVIGLVDCAGLRLQEATDALNGLADIYMAQTMASGVVPQITAIFGNCGGGLALIPALTDFTFMGRKRLSFLEILRMRLRGIRRQNVIHQVLAIRAGRPFLGQLRGK